jgi:hypothetical protein
MLQVIKGGHDVADPASTMDITKAEQMAGGLAERISCFVSVCVCMVQTPSMPNHDHFSLFHPFGPA